MSVVPMHPRAYGYMYAPNDLDAAEIDRRADDITRYAESGGYELARTYFEWDARLKPALNELIAELQRTNARYVLVRSLREFSENSAFQEAICERLVSLTQATVIVMDEEA